MIGRPVDEQRQSFWPLLPHQKMLPNISRILVDAHRSHCLTEDVTECSATSGDGRVGWMYLPLSPRRQFPKNLT